MSSLVFKRSIIIDGQKTSVSLENEFWDGLREIASGKNVPLSTLVKQIDAGRTTNNLSSAIRVFVFNHFYAQLSQINLLNASQRSLEALTPGTGFTRV